MSDAERLEVAGELDAANVPRRLRESQGWFGPGGTTVIDLAGVERADSAGVALLLEWVREARRADTTLVFENSPAQIRAIVDFCALNDVVPLQPGQNA